MHVLKTGFILTDEEYERVSWLKQTYEDVHRQDNLFIVKLLSNGKASDPFQALDITEKLKTLINNGIL